MYNDLVDCMLALHFRNIWFPSVHHVLDENNVLAANLTRQGDAIHLGVKGVSRFVSCINVLSVGYIRKSCLFYGREVWSVSEEV